MRSCDFLSAQWCERASEAAGAAQLPHDSRCRLEFRLADVVVSLVVADGFVAIRPGRIEDVDATLTTSLDVAWDIATCARSGDEAMAAMSVTFVLPNGDTAVGAPAPMGLAGRPELADMPVVPGVTLTVLYTVEDGPFGDLDYVLRFVDGQLVGEQLGRPFEPPDVFVAVKYRKFAKLRAGLCTAFEALEDGGRLEGQSSSLLALAALYERDALAAAMRATGAQAMALATLGELRADVAFKDGIRGLMRDTTPVGSG
jgi:hypothetical protein